MSSIRNRPDELLTALVDALRAGLADIVDEVNADALGRKNWALPAFDDASIDLALQPEKLPEWTEEPMIVVAGQQVTSALKSPPNLADRVINAGARVYLAYEGVEADPLPRTESKEATLSGALLAAGYCVERLLMRLSADGGLWGGVGVDDVVVVAQNPQIHAVADEQGQILAGSIDVLIAVNQEGLA